MSPARLGSVHMAYGGHLMGSMVALSARQLSSIQALADGLSVRHTLFVIRGLPSSTTRQIRSASKDVLFVCYE